MARIAGINLPNEKRLEVALTYLYGVGLSRSQKTCTETKVDPNTRVKDISETDLEKIRQYVSKNFRVEGDLRTEVTQNIKRLKDINSYRGLRHSHNLPAHGQRTKTNARTKRGKKVTMGSGRRTLEKT
ncbi:30S ribosomal protein S13 [Candidatus Berkelbacteria bacterium CG10_big_fil_rev_8_21_14_0_10_43_13]|uniref:Small ribosomal subunit protein uS13 n=1 Tax=Candidatus Berkelbacteria bacterium CG10_big_fil_rev_8_21_14_0_10_43_13 TaxID=1974514 RepID=A0A2H0W633_9BACT|nr:MAG: 30S ribosomal protein S13 [Candidatus Berkelbacteria bacterium CG10_big_fil_rev_8_21_14_0_10_43_13]